MSKYQVLWDYIQNNKKENFQLTFEEIKNILGFEIDHSFLIYKQELQKFGYRVSKISMKKNVVLFQKI